VFLLALYKCRFGAQITCQGAGVFCRNAAGKLSRGVGGNGFVQARLQLAQELMRKDHADILLAGLGEDHADVAIKIVIGFIDIDKSRKPLLLRKNPALLGCLSD